MCLSIHGSLPAPSNQLPSTISYTIATFSVLWLGMKISEAPKVAEQQTTLPRAKTDRSTTHQATTDSNPLPPFNASTPRIVLQLDGTASLASIRVKPAPRSSINYFLHRLYRLLSRPAQDHKKTYQRHIYAGSRNKHAGT